MLRQWKTGRSSWYTRAVLTFKGPLASWRTGPMGISSSPTKGRTKFYIWGRISSQALVFCDKLRAAQRWYKYFHFCCLCSICSADQYATAFYLLRARCLLQQKINFWQNGDQENTMEFEEGNNKRNHGSEKEGWHRLACSKIILGYVFQVCEQLSCERNISWERRWEC